MTQHLEQRTKLRACQHRLWRLEACLEKFIVLYRDNNDKREVFARAYQIATQKLIEKLDEADFIDFEWVVRLDEAFAEHYFRALAAYDKEYCRYLWTDYHQGLSTYKNESADLKPWWKATFDILPRQTRLEALVYPMLAHIVGDLPYALVEVGFDTCRLPDFHRVNDILVSVIGTIQHDITASNGVLKWLDERLMKDNDEILTSYGIRLSRGMAWYNAVRLSVPDAGFRKATEASLAKFMNEVLKQVTLPSNALTRTAFFIMRSTITALQTGSKFSQDTKSSNRRKEWASKHA